MLFKNLVKEYKGKKVLDIERLEFAPGRINGLIGANGAGKTTLFKCLGGMISYKGEIEYDQEILERENPHSMSLKGFRQSYQHMSLSDSLNLVENILIGCHLQYPGGWKELFGKDITWEDEVIKTAHEWLERFKIPGPWDRPISEYSHLDLRKAEIIRANISNPKVLLLDEPFAGLNLGESDFLSNLILDLKEEEKYLIVIDHDLRTLFNLCDWIYVLDGGSLIAEGSPEDIKNNPLVKQVYIG